MFTIYVSIFELCWSQYIAIVMGSSCSTGTTDVSQLALEAEAAETFKRYKNEGALAKYGVHLALISDNKVFLIKERPEKKYSLPGGKAEPSDADPEAALRRELTEELGEKTVAELWTTPPTMAVISREYGDRELTDTSSFVSIIYVCTRSVTIPDECIGIWALPCQLVSVDAAYFVERHITSLKKGGYLR
jgi:8-oxo-dGTP pyrophosphatase MutT (NUDIX family)